MTKESLKSILDLYRATDPLHSVIETPTQQVTYQQFGEWIDQNLRDLEFLRKKRIGLIMCPKVLTLSFWAALEALETEALLLGVQSPEAEVFNILCSFSADYLVREIEGRLSVMPFQAPANNSQSKNPGVRLKKDDSGFYLTTSGTTGTPKIIRRSWGKFLENAKAFAKAARYSQSDRILCTTPLHHSYALSTVLMSGLVSQATILFGSEKNRPDYLIATSVEKKATVVQSIPFIYQTLVGKKFSVDGIRLFLSAGEKLDPRFMGDWEKDKGLGLSNHYGTTEAGMLTLAQAGDFETVGTPLDGVELKISDEGELLLRDGSEEISTGDLAEIDENGRVLLKGRLIPLINLGGNKIDPCEIENSILEFPNIDECLVRERRETRETDTGQFVDHFLEALIVSKKSLTENQLREHLRAKFVPFKVPRMLTFVDQLPRTGSGKIRRGALEDGCKFQS